jgi:transposase
MQSGPISRKRYDLEFKREAVRLATSPGRSARSVADNLGINPNMLRRWIREFEKNGDHSFPGKGHLTPEEEKIRRLERELADVKEERDILKKAVAIFSKRPK